MMCCIAAPSPTPPDGRGPSGHGAARMATTTEVGMGLNPRLVSQFGHSHAATNRDGYSLVKRSSHGNARFCVDAPVLEIGTQHLGIRCGNAEGGAVRRQPEWAFVGGPAPLPRSVGSVERVWSWVPTHAPPNGFFSTPNGIALELRAHSPQAHRTPFQPTVVRRAQTECYPTWPRPGSCLSLVDTGLRHGRLVVNRRPETQRRMPPPVVVVSHVARTRPGRRRAAQGSVAHAPSDRPAAPLHPRCRERPPGPRAPGPLTR
jgi:hypothetical protein